MPSGSTKSRGQRLRDGEIPGRPIRGAGIRVDHENGRPAHVYRVEHSMVLHVEQRRIDEGRRRRLSLVEWWGHEEAPAHASRHVADLFARDADVLDFAIQAMSEKIERDRVRPINLSVPVRFVITATDVIVEGCNSTLVLDCGTLSDGVRFKLRIPLESGDCATQQRGRAELEQLCRVLGLRGVEDADVFVGHKATVIECSEGELHFCPLRFQEVAA